jgi:hypothetical protein
LSKWQIAYWDVTEKLRALHFLTTNHHDWCATFGACQVPTRFAVLANVTLVGKCEALIPIWMRHVATTLVQVGHVRRHGIDAVFGRLHAFDLKYSYRAIGTLISNFFLKKSTSGIP